MTFLITAGPTIEPIDPVRFLSNRSSGKMGYAIAEAAARQRHRVILISGPTQLEAPSGCEYIPVETAEEMAEAVAQALPNADIALFVAAVADYKVTHYSAQKLKKKEGDDTLTLKLIKNPDILKEARSVHHYKGLLVGFAAETEHLLTHAREKLARKGCDFLLANDVSLPSQGFNADQNTLTAVFPDHELELGTACKSTLGERVIQLCIKELSRRKKQENAEHSES